MNDDTISRQASFEKHGEIKSYAKDTIDRQEAIDIVQHECGEWKGLAKEIIKQFNGLPSAQPKQPGWIPCNERLPESYNNYLITTGEGDTDIGTFSPEFKRWYICDADGFKRIDDVIAWMSRPKPYEEEP